VESYYKIDKVKNGRQFITASQNTCGVLWFAD